MNEIKCGQIWELKYFSTIINWTEILSGTLKGLKESVNAYKLINNIK